MGTSIPNLSKLLASIFCLASIISCKARVENGSQLRAADSEVWPKVCAGVISEFADERDRLLFKTPSRVDQENYVPKDLRHFAGMKLMVEAAKKNRWQVCINELAKDAEKPYKIVALDIGSAKELVIGDRQAPQREIKNRIDNFAISSAGGISVTVNGRKFGCPANSVGWKKMGLYDGPKITKLLVEGYMNGLSDETMGWMRKSFCIHANLKK